MKYLGIDYGLKKMGLAISEGQMASIYGVVSIASLKEAVEKIKKIVYGEEINRIVVGVPGGKTGQTVKKFVAELNRQLKDHAVEIIEADETLSSKEAQRLMVDLNIPKNKRKLEDAYSASIILQNFLDSLE